jgi:transcription antitermination protein NusB
MISRRNIRIKVMQVLYAMDSMGNDMKPNEPELILKKKMDQSRILFIYLVYFITETARYAEVAAKQKASKHLPTAADLSVNTKIAGNELLWKIIENPGFKPAVNELKLQFIIDEDLLKRVFIQMVETPEYKEYISIPSRDKRGEKEILEFIFTHLMLPNDDFISHIEEKFIGWDDDSEMMQQLMLNFLQKPNYDFGTIISADKLQFARDLLQTVQEKKEVTMELIKPKLRNWDSERIATLDLIILQMGICEFLYFETIPTKVTINEYIDLAKAYSTPQSGQFVNGLLDNIHKELTAGNNIHKKTYKNSTI